MTQRAGRPRDAMEHNDVDYSHSVQTLAGDTHLIYAPLMHRALGALVLYLAQSIAARV